MLALDVLIHLVRLIGKPFLVLLEMVHLFLQGTEISVDLMYEPFFIENASFLDADAILQLRTLFASTLRVDLS
jgi:hypothetical protein